MAEITTRRNRNRRPTHPGVMLGSTVLPALNRPKAEIARLLGISRQSLYDVLAGKQPVTPETAIKLGKLCGNGPALWLNMQTAMTSGRPSAMWTCRQFPRWSRPERDARNKKARPQGREWAGLSDPWNEPACAARTLCRVRGNTRKTQMNQWRRNQMVGGTRIELVTPTMST